jgi:hypothetical protein
MSVPIYERPTNQDVLPGFETFTEPRDPDTLALQTVGEADLRDFMRIEDDMESPAALLEKRKHFQEAADAYVAAAYAYQSQGFYIKAAALKARAACIYSEQTGHLKIAGLELVDAIDLDRKADRFAKLIKANNGDEQLLPIRANYPNLYFSRSGYNRGKAVENDRSKDYTIFRMMNAHYALLLHVLNLMPETDGELSAVEFGRTDLYELSPKRGFSYEYQRRDGLMRWNHNTRKHIMDAPLSLGFMLKE